MKVLLIALYALKEHIHQEMHQNVFYVHLELMAQIREWLLVLYAPQVLICLMKDILIVMIVQKDIILKKVIVLVLNALQEPIHYQNQVHVQNALQELIQRQDIPNVLLALVDIILNKVQVIA